MYLPPQNPFTRFYSYVHLNILDFQISKCLTTTIISVNRVSTVHVHIRPSAHTYVLSLVTKQNAALSFDTQHAMSRKVEKLTK